jgi:hypothetical protein
MGHITGWGWYWLTWMFVGFLAPELYAVFTNSYNTLSWQFWGLEKINFAHPFDFADWNWLHYTMGSLVLIFVVWLGGHIIFGIWH